MIFVSLDLRILQSPTVSGDAVKLYGLLADSINTQTHVGRVSRERIGVYFGKSCRSVDRVLGELLKHGIVTSQRRYNQTSLYTVHHFDTLPEEIAKSSFEARSRCDQLQNPPSLEIVPDLPETVTPDLAEATSVTPDLAEATGVNPAGSPETDTPDLATYQDESSKNKKKLKTPPNVERVPASTADPRFVAFYTAYPRHIGKAGAFRKYQIAVKSGVSSDVLLAAATRYAEAAKDTDPQYIPYPETWLSKGRWDDEDMPARSVGQRRVATDGLSYTGTDGVVRQMPPSGRFRAE